MTIPELVKQGFKLFCIMRPSDKYKQGIDLDFTDELEDRSVPGVYILSNSKQEILKIGQSSDLYTRFDRMYKSITNTANDKVRAYVKDRYNINVYVLPLEPIQEVFKLGDDKLLLETSFASNLEKHLLTKYKNDIGSLPILNSGLM